MNEPYFVSPYGYEGKYKPALFMQNARFLYDRLRTTFIFDLPDGWDKGYWEDNLYWYGFIGTFRVQKGTLKDAVICNEGYFKGTNVFRRPNKFVSHSALHEFEGVIDEDCVIFRTDYNYVPLKDYVLYFAHTLSLCDAGIDMNLINSRLAYAIAAKDTASAKTIHDIMDKVYNGQPAVTYTQPLGANANREDGDNWNMIELCTKNGFVLPELLDSREKILATFDRIIGIPDSVGKKEREIGGEQEAQNVNTFSQVTRVYDILKDCEQKHNAMFPDAQIHIKLRNGGLIDNGSKADTPNGNA